MTTAADGLELPTITPATGWDKATCLAVRIQRECWGRNSFHAGKAAEIIREALKPVPSTASVEAAAEELTRRHNNESVEGELWTVEMVLEILRKHATPPAPAPAATADVSDDTTISSDAMSRIDKAKHDIDDKLMQLSESFAAKEGTRNSLGGIAIRLRRVEAAIGFVCSPAAPAAEQGESEEEGPLPFLGKDSMSVDECVENMVCRICGFTIIGQGAEFSLDESVHNGCLDNERAQAEAAQLRQECDAAVQAADKMRRLWDEQRDKVTHFMLKAEDLRKQRDAAVQERNDAVALLSDYIELANDDCDQSDSSLQAEEMKSQEKQIQRAVKKYRAKDLAAAIKAKEVAEAKVVELTKLFIDVPNPEREGYCVACGKRLELVRDWVDLPDGRKYPHDAFKHEGCWYAKLKALAEARKETP